MTDDPTGEAETESKASAADEPRRSQSPVLFLALGVLVGALALALYSGISARSAADARVKRATDEADVAVVNVVSPTPGAPTQEILLPGTTQAFTDAPIFARTNGYVKGWYFDIGAHVKQGQLLAEIETPEVDQQLEQARADLETAQANLRQAQITADRWRALLETDSVSKQETDQAVSALSAMKATVNSNAANVRRLEQLQGFEKIEAPFDGVITARNVERGDLVSTGSTAAGKPLFNIAQSGTLRIQIDVPQSEAVNIQDGQKASIDVKERLGREYTGTVVRSAGSLDSAARTMLTEVQIDNGDGSLLPGMYAQVKFTLSEQRTSLIIPTSSLVIDQSGMHVVTVQNNKVRFAPVVIGRDMGTQVEVLRGIQNSDTLVASPSDLLHEGQNVEVR
jgi:RND family efflux transporter MFP subunit